VEVPRLLFEQTQHLVMHSYAPFEVAAMARQSAVEKRSDSQPLLHMCIMTLKVKIHLFVSTIQLHLSGCFGKRNHPEMQKIRIIGFFFENRLHWQ